MFPIILLILIHLSYSSCGQICTNDVCRDDGSGSSLASFSIAVLFFFVFGIIVICICCIACCRACCCTPSYNPVFVSTPSTNTVEGVVPSAPHHNVYPATYGCINYGINDYPPSHVVPAPPFYASSSVQHYPPVQHTQPVEYSHSQAMPVGDAPPPYSESSYVYEYTESQGVPVSNDYVSKD